MNRKMYIHVYSGLASRCMTLMHAYYLIQKYRIENLVIIWQREKWCNISYYDVFDKKQFKDIKVEVIEYSPFGVDFEKGVKNYIKEHNFKRALLICFQWVYYYIKKIHNKKADAIISYFKKKNAYIRFDPPIEIGWGGGEKRIDWIKDQWSEVQRLLSEKRDFCVGAYCGIIIDDIETLKVTPESIKFKTKYNRISDAIITGSNKWVGVHIRRTDHTSSIEYSLTELFIEKMKKILISDKDCKFFLATDDKEVEKELKAEFSHSIVVYEKKAWNRNNKIGMESGIIDLLCLSNCDYILGSYMSVFSRFAALYKNKELFICNKTEE